jgi:Transposase
LTNNGSPLISAVSRGFYPRFVAGERNGPPESTGPDQAGRTAVPIRVPGCARKIFAEGLGDAVVQPFARRRTRLQSIVHHLGLALGGRPGQDLARRLLMPVRKDTLLRLVRARVPITDTTPRVIGIDDWAWKRGHRYGTIVCDLDRRGVIDVLPDREAGTVEAWLADHPGIEIVSRDRGGGYGQAVAQALPERRRWPIAVT